MKSITNVKGRRKEEKRGKRGVRKGKLRKEYSKIGYFKVKKKWKN